MKKNTLFLITLLTYFAIAPISFGQYAPYTPPTSTISILVEKKVGNPVIEKGSTTVTYVDNLGQNDHKFKANEDVWFQVQVKNTSNAKLNGVTLKDFVPANIEPIEGPGTYDTANRVLTVNAGDFEVNEEKTYTFKMRVVPSDKLPDMSVGCVSNKAQAYNNDVTDEDTAQLCIEKVVTTTTPVVKKIPSTGPEQGLLIYTMSTVLAYAGLKLRKAK